jgi:hypothetical protein
MRGFQSYCEQFKYRLKSTHHGASSNTVANSGSFIEIVSMQNTVSFESAWDSAELLIIRNNVSTKYVRLNWSDVGDVLMPHARNREKFTLIGCRNDQNSDSATFCRLSAPLLAVGIRTSLPQPNAIAQPTVEERGNKDAELPQSKPNLLK